jgi:hypothetical protein
LCSLKALSNRKHELRTSSDPMIRLIIGGTLAKQGTKAPPSNVATH